jgi:hypothetical protein
MSDQNTGKLNLLLAELQPQACLGDAGASRACEFRSDLRSTLQGYDG